MAQTECVIGMKQELKMTKETTTTVTYPMVSAIFKAEEFVKDSKGFTTVNEIQKMFLTEFYNPSLSDLSRIHEIESIAHNKATVIRQEKQDPT